MQLDWAKVDWAETAKVIGAIAGVIALGWKVYDEFGNYIHISIEVEQSEGAVSALSTVENKGNRPKKINYAFLLIGPHDESPIETGRKLCERLSLASGLPIKYTNHLRHLIANEPTYADGGRALIPLPFFYSENVDIADERLNYRVVLDASQFKAGAAYSVRFYIFNDKRLHRSTHDAFVRLERKQTAT
jgi:hypothetical protein